MNRLSNKNLFKQYDRKEIKVINPATLEILGYIPDFSTTEIQAAIANAKNALPAWRALTAHARAKIFKKWHELIIANKDDLAIIITLEQGKNLREANSEIEYAASFIEWFAEEAKRIDGKIIQSPLVNRKIFVEHEPVGVVAAITPWNFPSSMITRKIAPALASGCTIILKPSELTPFSALALGELAKEAGVPEGVFTIVTGNAKIIGNELTSNKNIKKISFTGSTNVGKLLIKQSADTVKRMSMELGGNAPFIIFDDVDSDLTIKSLMAAKFRNNGQTCITPNRIFIQDTIFDKYLSILIQEVAKLKIGNGLDGADLGPLISEQAIARLESLIDNIGGEVITGGKRIEGQGYFFEPTIIVSNIEQNLQEEIFGPVLLLYKFSSDLEALKAANETDYGLAAYLYTNSQKRINYFSQNLEYGMIGVNEIAISNEVAPFGGIKQSGFGREGSYLGIGEYLNVKYIHKLQD